VTCDASYLMFHITNQNTYYVVINSCITLFLADVHLLRRCPAFADTNYTTTGTHFFHQANLTSLSTAPLRLKPPTAVCALNHILHLTMEDDEVGPPLPELQLLLTSSSCFRDLPRPYTHTKLGRLSTRAPPRSMPPQQHQPPR